MPYVEITPASLAGAAGTSYSTLTDCFAGDDAGTQYGTAIRFELPADISSIDEATLELSNCQTLTGSPTLLVSIRSGSTQTLPTTANAIMFGDTLRTPTVPVREGIEINSTPSTLFLDITTLLSAAFTSGDLASGFVCVYWRDNSAGGGYAGADGNTGGDEPRLLLTYTDGIPIGEVDADPVNARTRSQGNAVAASATYTLGIVNARTRSQANAVAAIANRQLDAVQPARTRSQGNAVAAIVTTVVEAEVEAAMTRSAGSEPTIGTALQAIVTPGRTRSMGDAPAAFRPSRRSGLLPADLFPADLLLEV
jgi:hypothetical protein